MRFRPALLIAALLTSAPASAAADCTALTGERMRLEAEHRAGATAIADIALGKKPKRTRRGGPSAAQVGQFAAGTAASLLLPFPFGPALNLGTAAARRAAKNANKQQAQPPPAPEPDVEAMVRRQNEIEARLEEIGQAGC